MFYKLSITLATVSLIHQYQQYFNTDHGRLWVEVFEIVTLGSFGINFLILCVGCSPVLSSATAPTSLCSMMREYWIFDSALSLASSLFIVIFPIPLMKHNRAEGTWFPTEYLVILAMGLWYAFLSFFT